MLTDLWPGEDVRCTVDGTRGVYQGPEPTTGVFLRVLAPDPTRPRRYREELWSPNCTERAR